MKKLNKFKTRNIIVLGDIMLDKYIFGIVDRISPEAPVPIVAAGSEKYVPGGAANAANNVSTLGGNSYLVGIAGNDLAKEILIDESSKRGINVDMIVTDSKRPTIQKIRVLGGHQQLLRIDYENNDYIGVYASNKIIKHIKNQKNVDAIVISDYAKGTLTKSLIKEIIDYANQKKIYLIVDPKPKHKNYYKNAFLLTPNLKEAKEMTGINIENEKDLELAGKKLVKDINSNILITTGEKGMTLFEKNKNPVHIPTLAKEVFDVSGAGDTVIATLSLAISSGLTLADSANYANHAAGIKVGKLGTAPVTLKELEESINS